MRIPRTLAILLAFGLSAADSSPEAKFSSAQLSAIDPLRIAERFRSTRHGHSVLLQRLLIAASVATPASAALPIPLYKDLTGSAFPIVTRSAQARRYFSQGLLFNYGFNHSGAVRSFREAQRLDRSCAMCWWGEALALGPNINAPMDSRDRNAALDAADKAMALRAQALPLERALVDAVTTRYSRDPKADRAGLDSAYADAMLDVARRFPSDDDVAVLAAEAVMDTRPWNYWDTDKRTPLGRIAEAVRLVETVMTRNPMNLQASHLYVHLLEASDPQRAEAAADRLAKPLAPSAGHLVHMPSHIYHLRGRYADAIRVNIAAARSDEAFIRSAGDSRLVRYGYYPHNIHFIVTSAQMAGDMKTAISEARRLRTVLDPATSARIAWIQAIDAAPFLAMAQFASPDPILAMPPPDGRLPYAVAMRHYARAVACAQRRDRAAFDTEIAALNVLKSSAEFSTMIEQGVPAPDLLSLAEAVARGRFATALGQHAQAIDLFRQAIAIEARIPYQKSPYWYYPVQQSLGAALFLNGQFKEASEAFRLALEQTPDNRWARYGLARSEAAQGHQRESAAAKAAMSRAWLGNREWLRMERL